MTKIIVKNGSVESCLYNDYKKYCCNCGKYDNCDLKYGKDNRSPLFTAGNLFFLSVTVILFVLVIILRLVFGWK